MAYSACYLYVWYFEFWLKRGNVKFLISWDRHREGEGERERDASKRSHLHKGCDMKYFDRHQNRLIQFQCIGFCHAPPYLYKADGNELLICITFSVAQTFLLKSIKHEARPRLRYRSQWRNQFTSTNMCTTSSSITSPHHCKAIIFSISPFGLKRNVKNTKFFDAPGQMSFNLRPNSQNINKGQRAQCFWSRQQLFGRQHWH